MLHWCQAVNRASRSRSGYVHLTWLSRDAFPWDLAPLCIRYYCYYYFYYYYYYQDFFRPFLLLDNGDKNSILSRVISSSSSSFEVIWLYQKSLNSDRKELCLINCIILHGKIYSQEYNTLKNSTEKTRVVNFRLTCWSHIWNFWSFFREKDGSLKIQIYVYKSKIVHC